MREWEEARQAWADAAWEARAVAVRQLNAARADHDQDRVSLWEFRVQRARAAYNIAMGLAE